MIALSIVVVILAAILLFWGKSRATPLGRSWPLIPRQLLGTREQTMYWRLTSAFPEQIVLAQVAFSQLLAVKPCRERHAIFNRFRFLVADYVLCDRSFAPLLVIELDGRSHDHPRRVNADTRKAHALQSAGVPLLRLNSAHLPDEEALQRQVAEMLAPANSQAS